MNYIYKSVIGMLIITVCGCTKFLDGVPDSKLAIPKTTADFQQMLENENMFDIAPALGEFGTDDIKIADEVLVTSHIALQNGYIYAKDIFAGTANQDWSNAYQKIYYANIVLEGLGKINQEVATTSDQDVVKGWALFCRANAFYDLQEIFGQPFKPLSSSTDKGIPLKLSSNLNESIQRATVAETFDQITKDLEQAAILLPAEVSQINRSKPSKSAAYALLARVYLVMQKYDSALEATNRSLNYYKSLVDYNNFNSASRLPFNPIVQEVIYNSLQLAYLPLNCGVDGGLYNLYHANDLRKVLFFNLNVTTNMPAFKGYYSGNYIAYNGLTTSEVYLTRAECYARLSQDQKALDDLNTLLTKRYKVGTYIPYTIDNTTDRLKLVLTERRKECVFRNLRWTDLRRLNQDPRFAKSIIHTFRGSSYTLAPNDPKYVFPIPDVEIRASGIEQNMR